MSSPDVQILVWDSNWLGVPVARVGGREFDDPEYIAAAVNHCQNTGIKLLYLVLNPAHAAANQVAVNMGAQLFDSRTLYRTELTVAGPSVPTPPGLHLAQATGITPALQRLAIQSGEQSRFHLDARIGTAAFEALYSQWLQRTFEKGIVWTVATASEPVGLLAYAGHERYASIELLAVDPSVRRQGMGQFLVQLAKQQARNDGHDELQVVTQGANQPARGLYEQCGFQLLRTEQVYHLWL